MARGVGWLLSLLGLWVPAATESSEFTPGSLQLLHRAGFWDGQSLTGVPLSGVTTLPSMLHGDYLECCPVQLWNEALAKWEEEEWRGESHWSQHQPF